MALGEIKLWMGTGFAEVPRIKRDIAKLSDQKCARFLLIVTVAPSADLDGNIKELIGRLNQSKSEHYQYTFSSVYEGKKNQYGTPYEIPEGTFALIGILL